MFNWFDLMRQAQASAGFDTLMRQFQLSDEEARKAMLAFMPAFAMGLQHALLASPSNPFLRNLTGSAFQTLWQPPGGTFSPQAYKNGQLVLDQLFGSDEASRRIAHQAADFTGMSLEMLQQMLPLAAGLFAGSFHHWMASQGSPSGPSGLWKEAPKPPAKDEAAREAAAVGDPWTAFWTGWMQSAQPGAGKPAAREKPAARPRPSPRTQPPEEAAAPAAASPWQGMMETGQEMQMQYLKSVQSILTDAWTPGGRQGQD